MNTNLIEIYENRAILNTSDEENLRALEILRDIVETIDTMRLCEHTEDVNTVQLIFKDRLSFVGTPRGALMLTGKVFN